MLTLFNLGDMCGKYLSNARKIYNLLSVAIIMLIRWGFFASFILIALKYECNTFLLSDWFDTINLSAFAVLNGFITSSLFCLGPNMAKNPIDMQIIGFITNWSLLMGIMLGSWIAIPFNYLTPAS